MNPMLENLNMQQLKAVEAASKENAGPVLILAGAGTGKTTALIAIISAVITIRGPHEILAVTFTNKAANEMKSRISDAKGQNLYWCGTFHSICLKILRHERKNLQMRSDFLVFGEDEQKKVLKSVFASIGLDSNDYDPADWVEKISFFKDTGKKEKDKNFDVILAAYNEELARLNAIDFADIINHTNNLLIENPAILQYYQNLFKHILVDEFQDTNAPQYMLLKLLSAYHKNICCVGDDDQSIYSWRGAQLKNILNFEKDFSGAQVFRLTQNYRSTSHILNAANSLIKKNMGRLGKDLWSGLGDGQKVQVVTFYSDFEEANVIASVIENDKVSKKSDFAILIRNGSLSKKFEDEFISRQIPYRLVGAQKFYERQEVQDAIAYLRLLVYRFDDLSLLRVLGRPRRGLGDKAISELKLYSVQNKVPLFQALQEISLKVKQRTAANDFINAFDFDWKSMAPVDAALKLIEDAGYFKMWQESKDDNATDRIENIYELINSTIVKYDSLDEFLENASLMVADDAISDKPAQQIDAVSIMTIHAAKGLEFDNVFLPAWEEGVFPNQQKADDIEEERRLAYVAITRARRSVVITNAMSRLVFGKREYNPASRFINEIASEFIEFPQRKTLDSYKEDKAKKTLPSYTNHDGYVGKLVNHNELGSGVVIEQDGDVLTIAFKNKGIKKVAKQFIIQQ